MPRYFVKLAYDGTPFHGWQIQQNAHTVQEEIEKGLSTILGAKTEVVGCGRTDTGVHAKEFYLHFDTEKELDNEQLKNKLNGILPHSIGIFEVLSVTDEAHTRFDATLRSYDYRIVQTADPFEINRAYHFRLPLDVELMNKAASKLLEVKDFASFCKAGSDVKTTLCDVSKAEWKKEGDVLIFTISADRFLRNMVRAIVGTLMDVGLGKITLEEFEEVIKSGNRSEAGSSAPAHGLYLVKVEYPKEIFNK